GADGRRPVAVYCGVGISATHDIAALAMIGVEASLFCGSWSAWSSDPSRPVVIGARPD
ncbi:MAG: sulfurtransferase, partial [Alphaproteobacteria bacterium]|nr:sulfurtransferase [Alphaproteobacteria bacterium]